VALTTSSSVAPAASTMAFMFSKQRRTWASMSPATSSLVCGSKGICPDTQMVLPTRTACEYTPMAAGAASVEMTVLLINLFLTLLRQRAAHPPHIRHAPDGADDPCQMLAVAHLHLKLQ